MELEKERVYRNPRCALFPYKGYSIIKNRKSFKPLISQGITLLSKVVLSTLLSRPVDLRKSIGRLLNVKCRLFHNDLRGSSF